MFYEFNHQNHNICVNKNEINKDEINGNYRIPSSKDEKWSSYFDEDEQEQLRQMTIHGNIHEIYTISYQISLIDTPGYKQYIKNFIRYIGQSDIAILVFAANDLLEKPALKYIKSTPNEDKISFDGYYQLMDKLRICQLFEIKQLIITVNKLDKYNYSQNKFFQCKQEIEKLLKKVGYKYKNKFPIIPISAINGDNILFKSNNNLLKWWTNEENGGYKLEHRYPSSRYPMAYGYNIGYTVYDAIECINYNEIKMYNKDNIYIKPFKMSICNIYDEILNGSVLCGRIENGKIGIGTNVKCFPSGCYGQIKSIEMFNKKSKSAIYGDIIGLSLDSFLLHPQPGDIMINENNLKEYEVTRFEVLIDCYPTDDKINKKYKKGIYNKKIKGFKGGFSPLIMTNNSLKCQCQMINILWKLNKNITKINKNGIIQNEKIENAQYLEAGDTGKVLFEPNRQFPISALQKVVILEHQQVVMTGKVTKLHYADEVTEDF